MAAPVITVDGPSGTGKGTIASLLAKSLGWHMLDSGAIYRAVAWAAMDARIAATDKEALEDLLATVSIRLVPRGFDLPVQVFCGKQDITAAIRDERVGMMTSQISALPLVRQAVLPFQRDFRVAPGLVADGRDMGTVVFPDAVLKIYLDADASVRAVRRQQQLQAMGNNVSLREVETDLARRDQQDMTRAAAPLVSAEDAQYIDTSRLNIDQVFSRVMEAVHQQVM